MLSTINETITRMFLRVKDETGQALAEYGLILALIAVVCIVALGLIGTGLDGKLTQISDELA
jgi:pilus assembly protein Flp/PilA